MNAKNGMPPIHPGEILSEELAELGLSAGAFARALDVPPARVAAILRGRRKVSADTALRLARFFGTTPQVWLNLQANYELRKTEIRMGKKISAVVKPLSAAA